MPPGNIGPDWMREPSVKKWLLQDVRGCWMQQGVKGKGNMNVQAVSGQRGVRRSKDRLNLLPGPGCLTLLSLGRVSKSGYTRRREQPPLQTNLNVSRWQKDQPCCMSCPCPHAADLLRSQHKGSRSPTGAGAGHCCTRFTRSLRSLGYKFKPLLTFSFHSAKQEQNVCFGTGGSSASLLYFQTSRTF